MSAHPDLRRGVWVKGSKTMTGTWRYRWASDTFIIHLDSTDRVTGERKTVIVHDDTPEFNGWRLMP